MGDGVGGMARVRELPGVPWDRGCGWDENCCVGRMSRMWNLGGELTIVNATACGIGWTMRT